MVARALLVLSAVAFLISHGGWAGSCHHDHAAAHNHGALHDHPAVPAPDTDDYDIDQAASHVHLAMDRIAGPSFTVIAPSRMQLPLPRAGKSLRSWTMAPLLEPPSA